MLASDFQLFGFNDIFGYNGSVATITVGGGGGNPFVNYGFSTIQPFQFQLGQGGATSLFFFEELDSASVLLIANDESTSHDFEGALVSAVPVPAAVWLFGTALIGLVGFSKRKSKLSA